MCLLHNDAVSSRFGFNKIQEGASRERPGHRAAAFTETRSAQETAAHWSLHNLQLHCVDEDTVDVKFHAVIARHPSIFGPFECKCAA